MAIEIHSEPQHGVESARDPFAPYGPGSVANITDATAADGGGAAAVSPEPTPEVTDRPATPVTPVLAKKSEVVPAKAQDEEEEEEEVKAKASPKKSSGRGPHKNNVRKLRIERMMSKAELARRANLSVLTIDRVEKGFGCRMDSKRKILEALGLSLADRIRVFGEEE